MNTLVIQRAAWVVGLLTLCLGAAADVILLNDGTRLEGDVRKDNDGWLVVDTAGKVTRVPGIDVRSIELGGLKGEMVARADLGSLRRSAENVPDLRQVIDRFERFIEQHRGQAVAEDAAADLALWKERLARGLVKVAGKWATPEERAKFAEHSLTLALNAKLLVESGRLKEAVPVLQQALAEDPQNAEAWYLRGYMLYKTDDFAQSRKCFEAVNSLAPNQAPALNNLALALWRQNQQASALHYLDEAMRSGPPHREILNNVAEVLHMLADQARPPVMLPKVTRHFAEEDQKLQAAMAPAGWFRWGSTWVNQQELDQLKEAEAKVRRRLDALEEQFDALRNRMAKVEDDLRDTQHALNQIEATSWVRDTRGRAVRLAYPRVYYDLLRDQDRLAAEHARLQQRMNELLKDAQTIEKQLPKPKFTGVLIAIGPEGMPRRMLPATMPSTQP